MLERPSATQKMRAPDPPSSRPTVSVIVPFAGTYAEAREMLEHVRSLTLRAGDEIVVVDNQPGGAVPPSGDSRVQVVRDATEPSSYYARNIGVESTRGQWLLFIDSDCRPNKDLIDGYFEREIPDGYGILAGGVLSAPEQKSLAASYARSRGHVNERFHIKSGEGMAAGPTANLLVRRKAWDDVGGFHEGVRSGADVEFCFRVQKAGWKLGHRPEAAVEHRHPDSVRQMLRKARRYGAGRLWVERRFPGESPPQPLARPLGRCAAGVIVWTIALQPRRALYKLIDAGWIASLAAGWWWSDNRSRGSVAQSQTALLVGEFPFADGSRPDQGTRVEARSRPLMADREASRRIVPAFREDDPPLERLLALAWLWTRHPLRAARVARIRRRAEPLVALGPAIRRTAEGRIATYRGGPGYEAIARILD